MTERLDSVWLSRDYPVLLEVARRMDGGEDLVMIEDVSQAVGIPSEDVGHAALALERRGFVTVEGTANGPWAFSTITGSAYTTTGLHPDTDDVVTALVQMLRDAADQAPDEEERGRLRRAADGLVGVSRGVLQGLLTAYLTGQLPGH